MVHIEISSKDSFIGIYFCVVETSELTENVEKENIER